MRKITIKPTRLLKRNESYEALSIEQQVRMVMNGEQIEMKGKQMIYTERKDGVLPETNIRTDRFQEAQNALDYVERSRIAKRTEKEAQEANSASEPTQAQLPSS